MGSGRKPQANKTPWTDGHVVAPSIQPHAPVAQTVGVVRPDMPDEVAAFWDVLAPLALEQGTLVPATALELKLTCEVAVQQRLALANIRNGYGGYATLTKILEGKLRAFRLAPMGRELAPPASKEKPLSPLEKLKQQRQSLHAIK